MGRRVVVTGMGKSGAVGNKIVGTLASTGTPSFFVHPGVPVRSLTGEQLRAIFAGEITSWKDVGGPDVRIRVVRREEADSSISAFRAAIPEFRNIKFTERSKFAVTTQDAIDSIRDNEGAIGFASYSSQLARQLDAIQGLQQ